MQYLPNRNPDRKDVSEFLRKIAVAKSERDAYARIGEDYYENNQYLDIRPQPLSIHIDPDLVDGITVNMLAVVVDNAAASMMGVDFSAEGYPVSADNPDVKAAQVASAILRDHDIRNGCSVRRREMGHRLLLTGSEAVRIGWDENQLAMTELPPEQAAALESRTGIRAVGPVHKLPNGNVRIQFPLGGTTEHHVSANLIFPESGAKHWDEVETFCAVEYMSVVRARNMFASSPNAHQIKAMPISNLRGSGFYGSEMRGSSGLYRQSNSQTGDQADANQGVTMIVEYWEKTGLLWDQRIVTGERLDVLLAERRGLLFNTYDLFTCKPVHWLWGKSLARDMIRIQYAINKMATVKLKYLTECVKDVWLVPYSSDVTPLSNDFSQIVLFDSAFGPPQFKGMDGSVLAILDSLEQRFIEHLFAVGQISSSQRGEPQQRLAGRAIQTLIEANTQPLLDIRARMREVEKSKARKLLLLAREMYKVPRLASLMGDYSESAISLFSRADLTNGTDVQIVDSDQQPKSRDQRLDLVMQLFPRGFFAPENEQQRKAAMHFVETGDLDSLRAEEVIQAEKQAEHHIWLIEEGKVFAGPPSIRPGMDGEDPVGQMPQLISAVDGRPLFDVLQNHPVHYEVLLKRYNDPSPFPEQGRELLRILAETHRVVIEQGEIEGIRKELEIAKNRSLADHAGQVALVEASAITGDRSGKAPDSTARDGGLASGRVRALPQ